MQNFSLLTYYIAAASAVVCDITMAWLLTKFANMGWIFPFQGSTLASSVMALAYAMVMFELSRKIKIINEVIDPNI